MRREECVEKVGRSSEDTIRGGEKWDGRSDVNVHWKFGLCRKQTNRNNKITHPKETRQNILDLRLCLHCLHCLW